MKLYNMMLAGVLLFSINAVADETSAYEEARTRISNIVTKLRVVPSYPETCGWKAGETYTITATIKGYNGYGAETMEARMLMYDCLNAAGDDIEPEFTCGGIASSPNSVDTGWVNMFDPVDEVPAWLYEDAEGFVIDRLVTDVNLTFTIPPLGEGDVPWPSAEDNATENGREVVFRWFQLESTAPVGANGLTLLVGTRSAIQYGVDMRRLRSTVTSDLNVTDPNCGKEQP